MDEEMVYYCDECEKITPVESGSDESMLCCGKKMKKMPRKWCTSATVAEHARLEDDDEPCDI
ncbi:MAG: hypothetical protein ACMUIG_04450 [Thermoplasmatota archaeon]